MRLIDADELKRDILKCLQPNNSFEDTYLSGYNEGLERATEYIDNAPTVKYPFYAEAYQTGYEEAKKELGEK